MIKKYPPPQQKKEKKKVGSLPLVAAQHTIKACGEKTLAVIRKCHTTNTTTLVVMGTDAHCAILAKQ